jgi:hypothetical protein
VSSPEAPPPKLLSVNVCDAVSASITAP